MSDISSMVFRNQNVSPREAKTGMPNGYGADIVRSRAVMPPSTRKSVPEM